MNVITICHVDDLREIIGYHVNLSGLVDDEIGDNMWCIALEQGCISHFTVDSIVQFFDALVTEKTRQIRLLDPHKRATLYVWFDRQALQLRLNILSGVATDLPFHCQLRKVSSLASIVDDFLNTVRNIVQQGDQVEFMEPTDPGFDDESDEQDFILDVYVVTLNQS